MHTFNIGLFPNIWIISIYYNIFMLKLEIFQIIVSLIYGQGTEYRSATF
jgi:hypothetical protein